mmetsp:Transcript_15136/g.26381  ORF Transcript_15136/g.26381 Transcript_15136/m.26381 type:complete len:258 (+) Transcript_15136:1385-2158(+)
MVMLINWSSSGLMGTLVSLMVRPRDLAIVSALTRLMGTSEDPWSIPLIAYALIIRVSSFSSRKWYSILHELTGRPSFCAMAIAKSPRYSANFARGRIFFSFSSAMAGALTNVDTSPPASTETTDSEISMATSYCASSVDAPRCGVPMIFGCTDNFIDTLSGCLLGGSSAKQSNAAPATLLSLIASSSACSSMTPPRAALMIRTPVFIACNRSLLMRFLVESKRGKCNVTKSATCSASSNGKISTPTAWPASLVTNGS